MADDSRIDPRYDPVFQRGGEAAAPTVEPRAERPMGAGRPRETEAFVGLISPGASSESPADSRLDAPTESRFGLRPETPQELPIDDEQRRRGINPFLVVLGAIAVLLVVLGFAMTGYVVDHYGINAGPAVDYMLMQIYMIAAPLTALLGVSTAIGVLFVFAVRWRSAR